MNPRKRFREHVQARALSKQTNTAQWVRSLVDDGVEPAFWIVETVERERWAEREAFWIRHFRELGCNLTNVTDGGGGTPGYVHPEPAKARTSETQKEVWQRPGYRERMTQARTTGRWSRKHDQCIVCGRTDRRHAGNGKCVNCYNLEVMRAKQPDRIFHEWTDNHERCIACGTTERRHKGRGLCTACYAAQKYRAANSP